MEFLNLTTTELLWIGGAILGLIILVTVLRFILSVALGLIRLVIIGGGILILLYLLYSMFLN